MKQLLFLLLSLFCFTPAFAAPHFIENAGQIQNQHGSFRSDIDFVLKEKGFQLYIGKGVLIWQFQKVENNKVVYNRMEARLLAFNPDAKLTTAKPLLTQYHYYLPGCGPDGAHAKSVDKITYKEIYPGIDWEIYINQNGKVEYDFVLHPGAALNHIKMEIKGAEKVTLPGDGSFLAVCALGEVRQALPLAFDSKGNSVACSYDLAGNMLSFSAAAPKGEKWRIDPELDWGTYFGGEGDEYSCGVSMVTGNRPLIYGRTKSTTNIATTGTFQDTLNGVYSDIFLAQFNSAGQLLWGTYLGGNQNDWATGAAADAQGNIFITGGAVSANLATPGAYQSSKDPANTPFIARFNSAGQRIWFTYFSDWGDGTAIAYSPDSTIYVTGVVSATSPLGTPMPNIATPGAHQGENGGISDAFLVKMNLDGQPIWATYYGGSQGDGGHSVFADEQSNVYLTGLTASSEAIATPGSFQNAYGGGVGDAFLAKFTPAGYRIWGTYLGGPNEDAGYAVIAKNNRCYLLGFTRSNGLATPGAYQQTYAGGGDLLLTAWGTSGSRLWTTYYGGPEEESNAGLKQLNFIDNDLLFSSRTKSVTGIATADAYMPFMPNPTQSGFLARFTTEGTLLWGSYMGGNGVEDNVSTAVGDSNVIYIAGTTTSTSGISTPGAHQETNLGSIYGRDAYLIKLRDAAPADTSVGISPATLLYGNAIFTINPNPVQQTAILHGMVSDNAFPLQLSCTNAAGKTIWQQTLKQPEDLPLSLDFSRQPAGVYLLHIKGKDARQSLKVVKE